MPILTQEPHQTHLQSILPSNISQRSSNSSGSRPAPLVNHQSWRGRKRSRSPSTSPVASMERMWRPWSGVTMAGSGEGVGAGIGNLGGEQRQRAFAFGGESFGSASSYASGVGLVVPVDQPSHGESSISQTGISVQELGRSTSSFRTITSETRISISELDHATSATSRPHRSRVPMTSNPQSNSLDVRDIKHPQPQPSDVPISGLRRGTRDVVPVWDVNASINNQRMEEPESGMPRALETTTVEPMRKDVDTREPEETENPHYLLTNAVLRDLVSPALASC
jgi:hypothetical protein